MLGLVKACFRRIRDIDADVDVIVEDGANKRDGPFRRIESHDSNGSALAIEQRTRTGMRGDA